MSDEGTFAQRHRATFERLPDLLTERDDDLLRHLADCHDCQRRLFLLQRVHDALRAWQPAPVRRALRKALALAVAAAVAVALTLSILQRGGAQRAYTISVGPNGTVRATLARGEGPNDRLDLRARGLPRPLRTYLLWGRTGGGRRELLGRFMVDRRGSCNVRLSLPHRAWATFAVTAET